MKKIHQLIATLIIGASIVLNISHTIQAQELKQGGIFALDENGNFVEVHAPMIQFIGGKTHDFGKIPKDGFVQHYFKFKNVGTKPLLIQDAKAACGCTIPQWSEEPISPQQEGSILVEFDTEEAPGYFFKDITVTSNAHEKTARLFITGTVLETGEEETNPALTQDQAQQIPVNEKQLVSDPNLARPTPPTVPQQVQDILYPTPENNLPAATLEQPTNLPANQLSSRPDNPPATTSKKRGRRRPPVPTRPVIDPNPQMIPPSPPSNAVLVTPAPAPAPTPTPTPAPAPTPTVVEPNQQISVEPTLIEIKTEELNLETPPPLTTGEEQLTPNLMPPDEIVGSPAPKTIEYKPAVNDALITTQPEVPAIATQPEEPKQPYVEVTKLKVLMQSVAPAEEHVEQNKTTAKPPQKRAIQIISQPKTSSSIKEDQSTKE